MGINLIPPAVFQRNLTAIGSSLNIAPLKGLELIRVRKREYIHIYYSYSICRKTSTKIEIWSFWFQTLLRELHLNNNEFHCFIEFHFLRTSINIFIQTYLILQYHLY